MFFTASVLEETQEEELVNKQKEINHRIFLLTDKVANQVDQK